MRMTKFFALKLNLFGQEKLGRDILLSDLGTDELELVCCSGSRWLSQRDRSGRAILFMSAIRSKFKPSFETRFRALVWACFHALKDKDTQKHGMLLIVFIVGRSGSFQPQFLYRIRELVCALPIRFVGLHICYDNPKVHPVISLLLAAFDRFLTARCRSHFGKLPVKMNIDFMVASCSHCPSYMSQAQQMSAYSHS
jgi:hypothetical protein